MNEVGIQNAIEIASDYFNIQITEEWLIANLDKIASYFPAEDDEWYLEEFPDEECWWSFRAECENGTLSDTSPREQYGEALAQILTGDGWPTYADGHDVAREFYKILAKACDEQDGLEYTE